MDNRVLLLFAGMMVLLLVVAGCSRKVTSSITTEVSDSVRVKEVPRFITVTTPADTVLIERLVECDSVTNKPKPFTIEKRSKQARLSVSIDNTGKLTGTGICDSLQKVIEAKDREIYHLRKEKSTIKTPVYTTSDFDIFCRWWFAVTAVIIIITIFIFLKLKNF